MTLNYGLDRYSCLTNVALVERVATEPTAIKEMTYPANVVRIMIASPSDVEAERDIIRDVIADWNAAHSEKERIVLIPVGWEKDVSPELGKRAQQVINDQVLKNCDALIAVFWHRFGSNTGDFDSGTLEEIERHREAGKPTMLYFSERDLPYNGVDDEQKNRVREYRSTVEGCYRVFSSPGEFRNELQRDLAKTVNAAGWGLIGPKLQAKVVIEEPELTLSEKAKTLLVEASSSQSNGRVSRRQGIGFYHVAANGVSFYQGGGAREQSEWDDALTELCSEKLLEDEDTLYSGKSFKVTSKGYSIGDKLRADPNAVKTTLISQRDMKELLKNEKAKMLLMEASSDNFGMLRIRNNSSGWSISTNQKEIGKESSPREKAELEEGLELLRKLRLLRFSREGGSSLRVTGKGYLFCDNIVEGSEG